MAVTRDSASAGTKTSATSVLTYSHTAGGSNPYLLVAVFIRYDEDVSSVTFGSTDLELIETEDRGAGSVELEVWGGFVTPGTSTVTVTLASSGHFGAGSISYNGVDTSSPVGTPVSTNGSSTSPSATGAAANANERVFACVSYSGEGTFTVGGTGTAGGEIETGTGDAAGAWWDAVGEADNSVNVSGTLGSSVNWCCIAVPLNEGTEPTPSASTADNLNLLGVG